MYWKKLGNIYNPKMYDHDIKLSSHGANPLPIKLSDNTFRIYFNGRDLNNRSSIGALDYDLNKNQVVKIYHKPFFSFGSKKSFFSDGVSLGGQCEFNNTRFILFMGWKLFDRKEWVGKIGKLEIKQNGDLVFNDNKPFFGLNEEDRISLS